MSINSKVTVTAESTKVLSSNPARLWIAMINSGNVDCTISLGETAVDKAGIWLRAGGGSYEFEEGQEFFGQINAITASGTTTLSVVEISSTDTGSRVKPV